MLTINFHNNVAGIHFCSFGNRTKTDARSIIKNLAAQIAGRNEDYNLEIKKILTRESNIDNLDAKRLFELFRKEIDIIPTEEITREDYNIILEQSNE